MSIFLESVTKTYRKRNDENHTLLFNTGDQFTNIMNYLSTTVPLRPDISSQKPIDVNVHTLYWPITQNQYHKLKQSVFDCSQNDNCFFTMYSEQGYNLHWYRYNGNSSSPYHNTWTQEQLNIRYDKSTVFRYNNPTTFYTIDKGVQAQSSNKFSNSDDVICSFNYLGTGLWKHYNISEVSSQLLYLGVFYHPPEHAFPLTYAERKKDARLFDTVPAKVLNKNNTVFDFLSVSQLDLSFYLLLYELSLKETLWSMKDIQMYSQLLKV